MKKQDKPRRERREYRKPVVERRQRLSDVTEAGNIFVTGGIE